MTEAERREAAGQFCQKWANRGREDEDDRSYWIDFLMNVMIYNNFPWCNPTEEQRAMIEKTAQGILDARALYPDSSLADLYDPLTMPSELQKAHTANDKAVMQAYGFNIKDMSEADCVAALMKMYQEITEGTGIQDA